MKAICQVPIVNYVRQDYLQRLFTVIQQLLSQNDKVSEKNKPNQFTKFLHLEAAFLFSVA